MSTRPSVGNDLIEDEHSVWRLKNHSEFGYSDGLQSEAYLDRVLRGSADLSTRSEELETYIKDWPSEYHLTTKRAQLLEGFAFDRKQKVLEVGCGCGAITRHLGEHFDHVVSVEGNLNRARLARQRTRELDSVSIICAPFQEIRFSEKFDVIMCIGVFEYSGSFIDGDDPYEAALRYFAEMLTPDGIVVIAIENQFGLKYFSSAREDHLGVMFEGLEGYHRRPPQVRTFGKVELESRLTVHFQTVKFFYPYPDYKLPDCVVSSEFLASGRAGELISQMKSRDYSDPKPALWDEGLTSLELSRNSMLEFFANSFLVVAGRSDAKFPTFDQLAIMFSSARKAKYSTVTRVKQAPDGRVVVSKRMRRADQGKEDGVLRLTDTESEWIDSLSLQSQLNLRARSGALSLVDIFAPCRKWVTRLKAESRNVNGVLQISGEHIDSIWPNAYLKDGECQLVDREWTWNDSLRLNAVIIRAIYDFLSKLEATPPYATILSTRSGSALIRQIGAAIDMKFDDEDFAEFIRIESELQWLVFDVPKARQSAYLRWYLRDRPSLHAFRKSKRRACSVLASIRNRLPGLN